jgi:beta-galactosidase
MALSGMSYDMMRSIGSRRPWILMEQASSQVNWRQRNAVKKPGVMRLGSYQALAHGADGIMFFQWRQSKAGAEKHHSGMVPHGGTDTRVWREVKGLGNELKRLDTVLTSRVKADVAILMDWNNWWALELDSKPSSDLKLVPQLYSYYKPLFDRNIIVDFAHPESDLSRYKLVIAPNLYLVSDASVTNINQYVENGGNLVMSFFSGIVDENEHIRLGGYPAPFREMLGLTVEEFSPYSETQTNSICTTDGRQFQCTFWGDVIHINSAKTLATFENDYYAGNAAVTKNQFGNGNAFYVGTLLDNNGMSWLTESVCKMAGVQPTNVPTGVELLRRTNGKSEFVFALNYSDQKTTVPLEGSGIDLLTGNKVNNTIELEPKGVAIVQVD